MSAIRHCGGLRVPACACLAVCMLGGWAFVTAAMKKQEEERRSAEDLIAEKQYFEAQQQRDAAARTTVLELRASKVAMEEEFDRQLEAVESARDKEGARDDE